MSWHDTLADAWRSVVTNTTEPGTHPRDLAASLGRTEAELLAAGTPETGVRRLQPDWPALLHALPEVGEVMVLTRNEHAVHEKTGRFGNIRGMGNTMLVLNDAIDLRLFTSAWRHGFDVTVPARGTERRSIQIFDRHGDAVLKIYRTQATNSDAFDALCRRFHAPDLEGPLALEPRPALDAPRPDDEVDLEGLRSGWEGLTDVHKFRQLLKDTGADRHQALRLIGRKFAEEVQPDALSRVLSLAASQAEPIMVFVGNRGCVQIHTGRVERIVERDGWINVLDPGFNLHVRADATASAWVVRKPQAGGMVSALELYDANQQNFAILYGARPAGMREPAGWRAILETIPRMTAVTEAAE